MENKLRNYFERMIYDFGVAERMFLKSHFVFKDNRLLIKIVKVLASSVDSMIKLVLLKTSLLGKIRLSRNPQKNYSNFLMKIAPNYFSDEEIANFVKILKIASAYEKAPMAFVKGDKFVMFGDSKYSVITEDAVRNMISVARNPIEGLGRKIFKE